MKNKTVKTLGKLLIILTLIIYISPHISCADSTNSTSKATDESFVHAINGVDQFNKILESSAGKLLMFDLYADWCMPCRKLSPMLEEIAQENKDKVTVYKINVDNNRDLAAMFGVSGIPFVAFVKDKKGVHALTGLHPKESYVRVINQFSAADKDADTPNGKIIDGIRIIKLTTMTSPGKIFVYRGETVKLIIEKVDHAYSIHIPEYKISREAEIGKDLEVQFKAKDIGVFPIFCNGECPYGDGSNYGQIIVMQYQATGDAKFSDLTVAQAKDLIKNSDPLILDVRTPNEFYSGHLKNAKLIPLYEIENRLNEIEAYKNKDILIYCRSGNRSTVASEILIHNGFKKLHNLRHGVIGWQKEGNELVK